MIVSLPTDGMNTIVPLRPDVAVAWKVMPEFLERVKKFAAKYTPEADVGRLLISIVKSFPHMAPYFGFALIGNDSGKIVGHSLISLEREYEDANPWVTIHHVESDVPLSEAIRSQFVDMVEEYAQAFGAKELRLLALSQAHARYYRRWGFGDERIWMRRELEDKGGTSNEFSCHDYSKDS